MKLIFLNAWSGKAREGIVQFLQDQSPTTDVFCFQEADGEMKDLAQSGLADYRMVEAYKYLAKGSNFPQATYVKNPLPIGDSGTILENETFGGLGLYVQVPLGSCTTHIVNFHGVSRPVDKLDDPARLKQSERLLDFCEDKTGPRIVGGDFNLLPETRSIEMFAEKGYRDLIKEFRIETTRNRLAWDMYPNNKQYFCDYVFVSPEVKLKSFSVPSLEISDHLPLILEIEP